MRPDHTGRRECTGRRSDFSSPLLRQKMDGLGRAFPLLASEGRNWPTGAFPSSSLEQVFASALRGMAVQQAENLLERTLLERYGIAQVSAMNPGSLVWSLEEQVPCLNCWPHCPRNWVNLDGPSLMMRPSTVFRCVLPDRQQVLQPSALPQKECPTAGLPLWSPESGTGDAVERIGGPCRG